MASTETDSSGKKEKHEATVSERIEALADIYEIIEDFDRESMQAILETASVVIGNKK